MNLETIFPKTFAYLQTLDINKADKLDVVIKELLSDETAYERASQALRRRFSRGAKKVEAIDRNERKTEITREACGGKYRYFVQGTNGSWNEPDERIWIVAMYALWQASKKKD